MNKKLIALIMALILVCAFVSSCNSDAPQQEESLDTTAESVSSSTESESIAPVIVKDKFVLKSGKYELEAVYTYVDDAQKHPAVLLIAGSGPSDCDSTVGSLKPLEDIANALVEKGISSLRVDKRTFNYAATFADGGIEEEYLEDCHVAINYLKDQSSVGDIYLLGHSMGGQIACILQNEIENISGTILFNSSLRHLADIACDQYSRADVANKAQYRQYADMAKEVTSTTAKGLYYYSAKDYYWASYNKYDFANLAKSSSLPMLIINSTSDLQCFEVDISLWQTTLGNKANATIIVDETISHLGYEIDLSDPDVISQKADFPQKIIDAFVDFIDCT